MSPDTLEQPLGFAARTELEKAAWDNGFRVNEGIAGRWLARRSTTAPGRIHLSAAPDGGPWLLAVGHGGVWAELSDAFSPWQGPRPSGTAGALALDTLGKLHRAVLRAYRLARALPEAPLEEFLAKTAMLPKATEAERLVVQRVGQDVFRAALMEYWNGRCPITGVEDNALLRASHIVPWAKCATDAQRLDVHNGLLLAAHWDAAFDAGLITFGDDGSPLASPRLSGKARAVLAVDAAPALHGLTDVHRANLSCHRTKCFQGSAAPPSA